MSCMYPSPSKSPEILYPYIKKNLLELIVSEKNWIANMANTASTLGFLMPDLNWAGFYLYDGLELVLGAFWGRPAVTRISIGQGVCGTSAQLRQTINVPDVHVYPGHIACDLHSNSELVIPIIKDGRLIGVLDIDSPKVSRFSTLDQSELEEIVNLIKEHIDFPLIDPFM